MLDRSAGNNSLFYLCCGLDSVMGTGMDLVSNYGYSMCLSDCHWPPSILCRGPCLARLGLASPSRLWVVSFICSQDSHLVSLDERLDEETLCAASAGDGAGLKGLRGCSHVSEPGGVPTRGLGLLQSYSPAITLLPSPPPTTPNPHCTTLLFLSPPPSPSPRLLIE